MKLTYYTIHVDIVCFWHIIHVFINTRVVDYDYYFIQYPVASAVNFPTLKLIMVVNSLK